MAKRFLDTNLFNDEWVCSLSRDAKLFFIYYVVMCDHAGVLRLNKKLCEFQTGLKSIDTLTKELGNSLVTVREGLYFMPKFIKFQYPNFPKSKVKQQNSAIKILQELGLWDAEANSYLTVSKELGNSYVYVNDNGITKEGVPENPKPKEKFIPPTLPEVIGYFKSNGYSEAGARKAFEYYASSNWVDSKGNKVKNWKQKMISVWFKDEYKLNLIQSETQEERAHRLMMEDKGLK